MREHRASKGEREYYTSFEDLAKAFGCKPVRKQTTDKQKLNSQREKFMGKHLCKNCKQPMTYIGGNQIVCTNEKCPGIKHEVINEETKEKRIWYTPSFDLLDNRGAEIAENIFAEN